MKIFKSTDPQTRLNLVNLVKNNKPGIIFTKGLPGSGKSTFVKELLQSGSSIFSAQCVRINKDDLRSMLSLGKFSSTKEKTMNSLRVAMIKEALNNGKWVFCDDTHIAKGSESVYSTLAKEIVCIDFTDVPLETCIKRDLTRIASVGKDVIMKMWASTIDPVKQNKSLESVYLFDLDGTLSFNKDNNRYFDPERYSEDLPIEHTITTLNSLSKDYKIIFVSGREEIDNARVNTENWIRQYTKIQNPELLMRSKGDHRPDYTVKEEIFRNNILDKFYCIGVFDDRKQVINLCWKAMGIPVFDVGLPWDFDIAK
jgi:predicted kinase